MGEALAEMGMYELYKISPVGVVGCYRTTTTKTFEHGLYLA